MRILFCNYEYPPLGGGAGVTTALVARELAKRHEVTVLTSHAPGVAPEGLENGVKLVRVPVFFRYQTAVANIPSLLAFIPMGIRAGKKLLKANRYDVINTHFVLPTGPVGDALSRFSGVPNVLFLHGGDLYDPSKFTSPHRNPLLRRWIRRLLRRADLVAYHSNNILEIVHDIYAPELKGIKLPAMIERSELGAASRKAYGYEKDDVLLVTVGRLVARKAVVQIISIVESLKQEKVRCLIIGTGPEERLLKEAVLKKKLKDRVSILGHVDQSEKLRILQMSDVYVSTSQHEGFGLVFLEAMACGIPIVCYDRGGQTDFLRDQKTGYIVPLNNIEVFKERCRSLVANPQLRKTMGEHNKRQVEDYYVERCALQYESAFKEVLTPEAAQKPVWLPQPRTVE